MLNGIFIVIVLFSIVLAAYNGRMGELTLAIVQDAGKAVTLAIGLIGVMAFFLGLMRVVQEGGLLRLLTRVAAPVMVRLFPSVPKGHPAMDAMLLNIGSNMLGLANAATPFGTLFRQLRQHLESAVLSFVRGRSSTCADRRQR